MVENCTLFSLTLSGSVSHYLNDYCLIDCDYDYYIDALIGNEYYIDLLVPFDGRTVLFLILLRY